MADRGRCSPGFNHNDPSLAYALDDPKGWKNCWGGFSCFSPRRQEKYQRAETHVAPGPIPVQSPVESESISLDLLNQVAILPPVMGAPPPSPVSFGGVGQSAASHALPMTLLSIFPENSERLDSHLELQYDTIPTDAPAGFYTLVTPPIYSTLTTASATPLSTAPFTPPPELAHLTTPSSPEVPFAQLLGPSWELHGSLCDKVHEHLTSQRSIFTNLEPIHQLYPCSSNGQLVTSSNFRTSSPEMVSPALEMEEGNANAKARNNHSVSVSGSACFEGFGAVTSKSMCDKPVNMEQVFSLSKTEGAGLPEQDGSLSPCIVHDSSEYRYWHKRGSSEECCSRCGELLARCRDLSQALEQTKRKLTLVERRANSIDEREKKFKQLMQWMQLGAKLQKQNSFGLSKEMLRQDAAFFSDLQECYLAAESSVNAASNEGNDT